MSPRRLRTAGATITTRMATVAIMKARLIGWVKNTDGSPPDINIVERPDLPAAIGPATRLEGAPERGRRSLLWR